jgi:hypothetical protein
MIINANQNDHQVLQTRAGDPEQEAHSGSGSDHLGQ